MLKIYKVGRYKFQFEEGTQPEGAVEVVKQEEKPVEVEAKAVEPMNKARKPANKTRKAVVK